ncbi:MAG: two-CW domain-containing protein [Bryobacteraceae bacterium]|jgi:hypothetical protein
MASKANCWEAKRCGRQPGGAKAAELGVCPAATASVGGINGGNHAGRICWAVAGTLCGGQIQGTFAQKVANCMKCEFFLAVRGEEGSGFKQLPTA